jgi:hypothetical protein
MQTSATRRWPAFDERCWRRFGLPTDVVQGHEENEGWFYKADVGPSRWIKVVVIYEAGRGSIITAFPLRSYP